MVYKLVVNTDTHYKRINMQLSKEQLFQEYVIANLGMKEISKNFGITRHAIRKLLLKFSIPIKKTGRKVEYIANHNFFSTWSHEMAYCLGFIAADGHVWKNRPFLTIGISKEDKYILEYIVKNISPNTKIRCSKNIVQINIHSEQIYNDLNNLGIKHNKTKNLNIDFNIPDEFFGDYLRGFFDGDGCIWVHKKHGQKDYYYSNIVCMSEKFVDAIHKKLSFGKKYKRKTVKGNDYFELKFNQIECIRLFDIMYSNKDCFKLFRKYEKFLKIDIQYNKWSKEEDEILKMFFNDKNKLISLLPKRTWCAIDTRIKICGYRKLKQ